MAKGLRSKSRKKAKKYTYDKDIKPIVQKFQEKLDKKMLVSMYGKKAESIFKWLL